MVWDMARSTIDPIVVEEWTVDYATPPGTSNTIGSSGSNVLSDAANLMMNFPPGEGPSPRVMSASSTTPRMTTSSSSSRPETGESSSSRPLSGSEGGKGAGEIGGGGGAFGFRPEFTSVVFYHDAPLVAVGDSNGGVTCYKLTNVVDQEALAGLTHAEKAKQLRAAMYPETFASQE